MAQEGLKLMLLEELAWPWPPFKSLFLPEWKGCQPEPMILLLLL